ncbi:MAG TPA: hypothetical protein VGG33_23940 [Polyangia bacterium]
MRASLALALGLTFASSTAFAALTNTYQVTGPVLEVRDDAIVVQKGKEKWEIARDSETKINGELQVGAKVTVQYRMTAANVEVKGAPTGAKADKANKADKADAGVKAADKKPAAAPAAAPAP